MSNLAGYKKIYYGEGEIKKAYFVDGQFWGDAGEPWLTGWTYRKSVTLSRASGAVNNYQMKLLVGESSGATGEDVDCAGHVLATFSDLRFTTSDGETLLDYWIESISGSTPNCLATVWIEFPTIGTGATTFYMYFGKADAAAASSGVNTFLLFDDFNDDFLDAAKWDNTGSFTESGGTLNKYASNTNTNYICISDNTYTAPLAVETRVKVGSDWSNEYGWNFTIGFDSGRETTGYMAGHYKDASFDIWRVGKNGTGATNNNTTESIAADTYYRLSLLVGDTNQKCMVNGVQKGTIAVAIQTNPTKVYMVTGRGSSSADYTTYFDWIAVRNYQETEPAWGAWGAEES